MIPYTEPTGDAQGLRNASHRLTGAASALRSSADRLTSSNRDAAASWESIAQQAFSLIAETMSSVIGGSATIAEEYAGALTRYAAILEGAQNDVRQARYRQQVLITATPVGMMPDQNALASLDAVVQQAHAAAYQAARELSAIATQLMGATQPIDASHGGADPAASFVSRAHTLAGQVTSAHPNAAAFDAQANQIEFQMAGVIAALTSFGAGNPIVMTTSGGTMYPSTAIVGGTSAFGTIVTLPAAGIGAGIIGGSAFADSVVTLPGAGIGAGIIGGSNLGNMTITDASGNVTIKPIGSAGAWSGMPLIEAAEDIRRRNAIRIWESVFPGVPPPDTHAGAIINQILDQADSLTPTELAAINILSESTNYGIQTQLLPDGFDLVRVTYG